MKRYPYRVVRGNTVLNCYKTREAAEAYLQRSACDHIAGTPTVQVYQHLDGEWVDLPVCRDRKVMDHSKRSRTMDIGVTTIMMTEQVLNAIARIEAGVPDKDCSWEELHEYTRACQVVAVLAIRNLKKYNSEI